MELTLPLTNEMHFYGPLSTAACSNPIHGESLINRKIMCIIFSALFSHENRFAPHENVRAIAGGKTRTLPNGCHRFGFERGDPFVVDIAAGWSTETGL